MPAIYAEFTERTHGRGIKRFREFVLQAMKIRGYKPVTHDDGRLFHRIDFSESDMAVIDSRWGRELEYLWHGTYYVNGRRATQCQICMRYLTTHVGGSILCPKCNRPCISARTAYADVDSPDSKPRWICDCGNDITELVDLAKLIDRAKSPKDLLQVYDED